MTTRSPTFKFFVNGKNVERFGFDKLQSDLKIFEFDEDANMFDLRILNPKLELTDDVLFKEKNEIEIFTGYTGEELSSRGKFILDTPIFENTNGEYPVLRLKGKSEIVKLAESDVRKVWRNITDSSIAAFIASENGFKIDAESTGRRYEHIAQMGISDLEFLKQRAELYGYQVYMENSTLHFHSLRNDDLSIKLHGGDLDDPETALKSFEVVQNLFRRGSKVKYSGVDLFTGKNFDFNSGREPDEVTRGQMLSGDRRRSFAITGEPQKFIVGLGHKRDRAESKTLVETVAQSDQWILKAKARIEGIPDIKVRRVLNIVGYGKYSGKWYIQEIEHAFKKTYSMILTLRSTTLGPLGRSGDSTLARTTSSGTRVVSEVDDVTGNSNQQPVVEV